MSASESWPLPLPLEDATTAGWWTATRERRLVVQRCTSCGVAQHYPRPLCTTCHGTDLAFDDTTGRAVVVAVTVVHRPPAPALEAPYAIALVDLEEGPRLLTRLVAPGADPAAPWPADADDPTALTGTTVEVDWWPLPDGRALPVFRAP